MNIEKQQNDFKENFLVFLKENSTVFENYSDSEKTELSDLSLALYESICQMEEIQDFPLKAFEDKYTGYNAYKLPAVFFKTVFIRHYFESDQVCDWSFESLTTFIQNFTEEFSSWKETACSNHKNCQDFILNLNTVAIAKDELLCSCFKCLADYRTKVRDILFNNCLEDIANLKTWIAEDFENKDLESITSEFSFCQKAIEKKIEACRYKLKRASINKIQKQFKGLISKDFDINSETGKLYLIKVRAFCEDLLKEEAINSDLIGDHEYSRFFSQMNLDLWKNKKNIRREFFKVVRSIFLLKRKDISSTIIQDHLGQFWEHSKARSFERHITYHLGPTNSGKTYYAIKALKEVEKGCYLAPLRLLASEQYDNLNSDGHATTLLTGEEVIETEGASHIASTIEMARINDTFDCCVIDEIQMIHDSQRGWAWTRALVNMCSHDIHLCGDASALELVKEITELTKDRLEVKEYTRLTKLNVEETPITLGELEKGDALIVFSRKNALKYKADLEKLGFKVSIVYGRLSPEVRREQARKFDQEETDIIVSTDAISMGMNLPIRRIVFSTLSKFINSQERIITDSEIKQIAGRAGRYKRYPTGFVTCLTRVDGGISKIRKAINSDIIQSLKAMVGPDLDIFSQVNDALMSHQLQALDLSEFLRLYNTMEFKYPFYCVDLAEMIQVAEMVEEVNKDHKSLSSAEIFGFSCAPVNLGLVDHVLYFQQMVEQYVKSEKIRNEMIDYKSDNIDYLETSIKCMELYQWLSRHFDGKNFEFDENLLGDNKSSAVEKLNHLLSEKIVRSCSSCGSKLEDSFQFNICETCFKKRRFTSSRYPSKKSDPSKKRSKKTSGRSQGRRSPAEKDGDNKSGNRRKRWKKKK